MTQEDKINVAELLKDCPKGMELDCTMIDNVVFEKLDVRSSHHPIIIRRTDSKDSNTTIHLTKYGQYSDEEDYKCVIFPKGKTTWEGFVPPREFKDGDVLVHTQNERFIMSIYKSNEIGIIINTHVIFRDREEGLSVGMQICCYTDSTRLATEEEKQRLFDAIKENGYRWSPETKTLEKLPKFKVGDKIKHKDSGIYCTLGEYSEGISAYRTDIGGLSITYKDMEQWELAPNKFDIDTLVPFESRVLVRDNADGVWLPCFFGGICNSDNNYPYRIVGGEKWKCCIPYEGNEHLLGKTDDCDEYYKNW